MTSDDENDDGEQYKNKAWLIKLHWPSASVSQYCKRGEPRLNENTSLGLNGFTPSCFPQIGSAIVYSFNDGVDYYSFIQVNF